MITLEYTPLTFKDCMYSYNKLNTNALITPRLFNILFIVLKCIFIFKIRDIAKFII
jgi:hypothetical protein